MITIYLDGEYWHVLEEYDDHVILLSVSTGTRWHVDEEDDEWSDLQKALDSSEFEII